MRWQVCRHHEDEEGLCALAFPPLALLHLRSFVFPLCSKADPTSLFWFKLTNTQHLKETACVHHMTCQKHIYWCECLWPLMFTFNDQLLWLINLGHIFRATDTRLNSCGLLKSQRRMSATLLLTNMGLEVTSARPHKKQLHIHIDKEYDGICILPNCKHTWSTSPV